MSNPTTSRFEQALVPTILTVIALGLAAGLAAFFPLTMVALYVAILPVPLLLVWVGRDVEAPIDRIRARDLERAKERARATPPRVMDRAA